MVGEAGHHEGSLAEVVGDVDIDLVLGEEEVQELGVVEDRGQVEAWVPKLLTSQKKWMK